MNTATFSRHVPASVHENDLASISVAHEDIIRRVINFVRYSTLTPTKRHTLLVGPWGSGKTHLTTLVWRKLQTLDEIKSTLLMISLRENEAGIMTFLDVLLCILREIKGQTNDPAISEDIDTIHAMPKREAERMAAELVRHLVGEKTLLLVVENLDVLLTTLKAPDRRRFHLFLTEGDFCAILATASRLTPELSSKKSAFTGLFQTYEIPALSLDHITELLINLAEVSEQTALSEALCRRENQPIIKAWANILGGRPRTWVILFEYLKVSSFDQPEQLLMQTLAELSPRFQSELMKLSPQQRKIVQYLLDHRHSVPVKEIAGHSYMSHQTASSQLKTLRDVKMVQATAVGRESYYEAKNPILRMSLEVRYRMSENISSFFGFLKAWHLSKTEFIAAPEPLLIAEKVFAGGSESSSTQSISHANKLINGYVEAYQTAATQSDFVNAKVAAQNLIENRDEKSDWTLVANCDVQLANWKSTISVCDNAIEAGALEADVAIYRSRALFAEGFWKPAFIALENALSAGGITQRDHLKAIATTLIDQKKDSLAEARFIRLMNLFEKYRITNLIGVAVCEIALTQEIEIDKVSETASSPLWCDLLLSNENNDVTLNKAIGIANTIWQFRVNKDVRVFLKMPLEERRFVQELI